LTGLQESAARMHAWQIYVWQHTLVCGLPGDEGQLNQYNLHT